MEGIVKHLKKGDVALKTLCANALFKVGVQIIFLTYISSTRRKILMILHSKNIPSFYALLLNNRS